MKKISKPIYDTQVVYETCTNSISDTSLKKRLNQLIPTINSSSVEYEHKAELKKLFTILPSKLKNDEIVIGNVTKKELKDLYSQHMVGRSKPARAIYDELKSAAPFGKCPFCGFGHVYSLDHYLPKAKYPLFSVLPLNLVPSCSDCNKGKTATIASTEEEQCLHPYFDHDKFINEQWIFAYLTETTPATISFFVNPPIEWDSISKSRVTNHFNDFKLADRFSTEAGSQLACLRDILSNHFSETGIDGVKNYLNIEANANYSQHRNSWQTAMFQALAGSDWYCSGGYE